MESSPEHAKKYPCPQCNAELVYSASKDRMVCQHCGAIQEFADKELCQEENDFAQNLGFHTEHHLSEFSGLCSQCYEK